MSKPRIEWDWVRGHFDGRFSEMGGNLNSDYKIEMGLQRNEDGVLHCTRLLIETKNEKRMPSQAINSRFLQTLGLGELLAEAKAEYGFRSEIMEEVQEEIFVEYLLDNWELNGSNQIPDVYYAAIGWKYEKFVYLGLDNPTYELSDLLKVDRATISSRIVEARKRGLLTKPKAGTFGGKLTPYGKKLIEMEMNKNAKES